MATLNDLVSLEAAADYLALFGEQGRMLQERMIKPLEEIGLVTRMVQFHMRDDRIPFVGIFVHPQKGETCVYDFPCTAKAKLCMVGLIQSDIHERLQVLVASNESGRFHNPPKNFTLHHPVILAVVERVGVEYKSFKGSWM